MIAKSLTAKLAAAAVATAAGVLPIVAAAPAQAGGYCQGSNAQVLTPRYGVAQGIASGYCTGGACLRVVLYRSGAPVASGQRCSGGRIQVTTGMAVTAGRPMSATAFVLPNP